MNWGDYEERYGESLADFDEDDEDRKKCAYCDCEDSHLNRVMERSYSVLGKHFKDLICQDCLAEEMAYDNQKVEPVTY